jgi:uncharacterized protein YbcI
MGATAIGLRDGELLAAISNLVVKVYADHIGRGPTKARAYLNEDIVICVMEDTMTKAERTLVESGHEEAVLEVRAVLQESMREALTTGIEGLTGHRVIAFISGSNLAPDLASELFVLDK